MEENNVGSIWNTSDVAFGGVFPTLDPNCYNIDTEHLVERFWLVTILGSTLSTISIVENIFLFLIFITSKQHRRSHSLYLLLLALTDLFISFTYILIMSVKVLYQYNEWVSMKKIWLVLCLLLCIFKS